MTDELVTRGEDGILRLDGDLDAHSAPELDRAVESALADRPADTDRLVLDVGAVHFVDSSGLRSLVAARQGGERTVVLRSPNRGFRRILEITGLDSEFVVEE
ncbi:MAG: STAS domain-containing protein [Acidimicrobiales bacterium]|jgi:anti-anti-sigma factor|nr:STAS domain-containing protein [Acidimicrobiales bacterium]